MKVIIRTQDRADLGGIVTGMIENTNLNGKPMAGKGNMMFCPFCKSECSVNGVTQRQEFPNPCGCPCR